MELKDTVKSMLSNDYKKRFIAEYQQLVIRYKALQNMINNWDKLKFTPKSPKKLYILQLKAMEIYISIIKVRAVNEDIEIVGKGEINFENP